MMRHHVLGKEVVNPEGGPLRYPMALAFSHRIPSTGCASPYFEGQHGEASECLRLYLVHVILSLGSQLRSLCGSIIVHDGPPTEPS